MRLRGAFNPIVQVAIGAIMIVTFAVFVVTLKSSASNDSTLKLVRADYEMIPILLAIGLAVGLGIGNMRLRALRKVLPEVDGEFYVSEAGVLRKTREGANAISLQRLGLVIAFLTLFGLDTFMDGRIILDRSMVAYVLGQYLTGQTLPFVRLFFELRKNQSSISPG